MLTFSVTAYEQEWVQFAHPQAHIAHYLVLVKNKSYVYFVCFLLGDSPASDLYMPTFRNTLSVPSSPAFEDGTDRVFRNVGTYINQTPGYHPKEDKQHSEHGESLKSRIKLLCFDYHLYIFIVISTYISILIENTLSLY